MGVTDRIAARVEHRTIGGVPWLPFVPFGQGGPVHPSKYHIGQEHALRLAPMYAAVKLLADGIASLPLKIYRNVDGTTVPWPGPSMFDSPAPRCTYYDWMHQGMSSLLLHGNALGFITSRDGFGYPAQIIWLPPEHCDIIDDETQDFASPVKARYFYFGRQLDIRDLLHVRAFTMAGHTAGLSPLAAFKQLIEGGLDQQEYSKLWFANGGFPPGVFKNSELEVDADQSRAIRANLTETLRRRQPLVIGRDWEYSPVDVKPEEAQFVECAVEWVMFSMADGTRRRADQLTPGDELLSWDGARLTPATVSAVTPMPAGPTVRVRTQCGRALETSPQHPYWAAHRPRTPGKRYKGTLDGNAKWTAASELRPGDYVRVALDWDGGGGFDPETAWAVGALVGDGCLPVNSGLRFAGTEPAIIERLGEWLGQRGASLLYVGKPGRLADYRINTGGGTLRAEVRELGILGQGAATKHVPEAVMAGGRKAHMAFLSGYLDTDGTVVDAATRPQPIVCWTSVSRRLLEECQHMLALAGVQSAFRLHDAARTRIVMGKVCHAQDLWSLTVCGRANVARLASLLDPAHPVKAARLAAWREVEGKTNGARSDVRWTRVVAVEDAGEQVTYGITVGGTHTHVTEGLVTHNTTRLTATEFASIYQVPPEMIGGSRGDSMTYANQEQAVNSLITFSLRPWMVRWEAAFNGILPQSRFCKFNADAMIRTDTLTRYQTHQIARDTGWLTAHEIRDIEDLPQDMGAIGDETLPGTVLVSMSRGMASIPKSFDSQLITQKPAPVLAPPHDPAQPLPAAPAGVPAPAKSLTVQPPGGTPPVPSTPRSGEGWSIEQIARQCFGPVGVKQEYLDLVACAARDAGYAVASVRAEEFSKEQADWIAADALRRPRPIEYFNGNGSREAARHE